MDAIILAGGKGTRLASVVSDKPKSLAPMGERPFLAFVLDELAKLQEINRIIVATGHLANHLEEFLAQEKRFEIVISHEEKPLGTGGAIKQAMEQARSEAVLVMNGDTFIPFDLSSMLETHHSKAAIGTLLLSQIENSKDFGLVDFDPQTKQISSFQEKPQSAVSGHAYAGISILSKSFMRHINELQKQDSFSYEFDVLPKLVKLALFAHITKAKFIDIGTPASYAQAQKVFSRSPKDKAKL